jgi:hypothetical protein
MINTSWMAKIGSLAAVVVLGTTLVLAQQINMNGDNSGSHRMLTGTVACAAQIHHMYTCRRYDTLQSCAVNCVQTGSQFALVVGNTPYLLQGDPKTLERFAGGKATVSGSLIADEIEVGSIFQPGRVPETFVAQEQPMTNAGR